MSDRQAAEADAEAMLARVAADLCAALQSHVEAMQALTQSNLMLSAAVAELLGEEAGKPAQPEEPKEPAPTSLDGDE